MLKIPPLNAKVNNAGSVFKSPSSAEKPKSARIPTTESESPAEKRRGFKVKKYFSFQSNEQDCTGDITCANVNFQKEAENCAK